MDMVSTVVLETAGTSLAADTPLMSAGLDSIAATALATTLAQRVDAELPQTVLFDHPTIRAVASFLASIAPTAAVGQDKNRGEAMLKVATRALKVRPDRAPTRGVALSSRQICAALPGCATPGALQHLVLMS